MLLQTATPAKPSKRVVGGEITDQAAKIGSLKTRLIISPVLGVLIGVGSAILLVSVILFSIMCCRVRWEKAGRGGAAGESGEQQRFSSPSPDIIPCNQGEARPGLARNPPHSIAAPRNPQIVWQSSSAKII